MDVAATTRMLQLAQVMQQLPADIEGQVPVAQVAQAREAFQAIPPAEAPAPLLVSPAQHVDLYA